VDGTKSLDSNAIDFTEAGINFVGRTFENNGVQGKIQKRTFEPNEPFTITATVIGNYKYVKFQIEPYYCSQNINKLTPKPIIKVWNEKIAYYFIANIQRFVSLYDCQQGGYKLEDIKKHIFQLPTKNGEIDFEFMESFMDDLESEHVAELEAYLMATGFCDYILTVEEQKVLEDFENEKILFGEFEIQALFAVSPSKAYKMNDINILIENGKTPYVSNQSQENGYIGWSDLVPLNPSNVITLSDTWQSEKTIFYQPAEFIGKSHLQVMKPYDSQFNRLELFYVISSFRKAILELKYDYGTKFNRGKINTTKIQLPIKDQQPDYTIMETLIRAIQKLVIKDVVLYVDRKMVAGK
jgi:hypothetical protein